jgi:hypothetical protein
MTILNQQKGDKFKKRWALHGHGRDKYTQNVGQKGPKEKTQLSGTCPKLICPKHG